MEVATILQYITQEIKFQQPNK